MEPPSASPLPLWEKLPFDGKIVTITVVSTLLLMMDHYHRLTPVKYYDRVFLYLVIPLVFIFLVFREDPRKYGFTLGNWRAGLLLTALGILLMTPVIWYLGKSDPSIIFGGFAFGWVAWRTRSFVYPFLIHWFISTFVILVAAGVL